MVTYSGIAEKQCVNEI